MCNESSLCVHGLKHAGRFVVETPQGLVVVKDDGSVLVAFNDPESVSPAGLLVRPDNFVVEVDPFGSAERSEPAQVFVDLLTGKTRTSTETIAERDGLYLDWAWANENAHTSSATLPCSDAESEGPA